MRYILLLFFVFSSFFIQAQNKKGSAKSKKAEKEFNASSTKIKAPINDAIIIAVDTLTLDSIAIANTIELDSTLAIIDSMIVADTMIAAVEVIPEEIFKSPENISITNATSLESTIYKNTLLDLTIENSTIITLIIEETTIKTATISSCSIGKLIIKNCDMADFLIEDSSIGEISLENSSMKEFETNNTFIKKQVIVSKKPTIETVPANIENTQQTEDEY